MDTFSFPPFDIVGHVESEHFSCEASNVFWSCDHCGVNPYFIHESEDAWMT